MYFNVNFLFFNLSLYVLCIKCLNFSYVSVLYVLHSTEQANNGKHKCLNCGKLMNFRELLIGKVRKVWINNKSYFHYY